MEWWYSEIIGKCLIMIMIIYDEWNEGNEWCLIISIDDHHKEKWRMEWWYCEIIGRCPDRSRPDGSWWHNSPHSSMLYFCGYCILPVCVFYSISVGIVFYFCGCGYCIMLLRLLYSNFGIWYSYSVGIVLSFYWYCILQGASKKTEFCGNWLWQIHYCCYFTFFNCFGIDIPKT